MSATINETNPDLSGTHVWLIMIKANRAMGRVAASSIKSSNLGDSDFRILEILLHKGAQLVNDLGRRVGLTSGAITSAVDRLEKEGLVTRESHPTDRRARVVRLTDEGKRRAKQAFSVHRAAMDQAATSLSSTERATLIRLLKKLGTAADALATREETKA